MSTTFDFEKIVSDIDQQQAAPLHLWHPQLSGDIDISIDRQGVWRHCGDEFTRLKIPALFSRILCREGDEYFLKTPVEKWRIRVEDVPFYFIHLHTDNSTEPPLLSLISQTQERVLIDSDHPFRVDIDPITQQPSPYIKVRDQMEGKLSRSLYYELVNLAEDDEQLNKLYILSGTDKVLLGSY
jgi:hypothetical protein